MLHGYPIQMHLRVGLEDKYIILNQCFNITLKIIGDCNKLTHSWNMPSQEENRVVGQEPQIYWN